MAVITYRQALNQAMKEEMRRDDNVFIMGEEVAEYQGAYKVTEGMLKEFGPKRVVDTPIAELGFTGIGVGAAMTGLRPIVEMMTVNFAILALDQIVNHAAKLHFMSGGQFNIPIVIRAPQGAGMQLGAQHSQNLEAWFAHIPGLQVLAASNPYNAKGLLKTAIRDDNPVIFLEHELLYTMKGEVPDEEYTIPIGQADVKRQGKDVTIISYLRMANIAMNAAESLEKEGIQAEVIDLQSLRPLDLDTCANSLKKTHHLIVVEEDWLRCGMGAEVIASMQEVAFDYLDAPMLRVAADDVPMPYSKNLERSLIPDEAKVIRAVRQVLSRTAPEEQQAQREQPVQARQTASQTEQEEEEEEEQARKTGGRD